MSLHKIEGQAMRPRRNAVNLKCNPLVVGGPVSRRSPPVIGPRTKCPDAGFAGGMCMGAEGTGSQRARTAGAGLGHSAYGERSVAANTAKARQGQGQDPSNRRPELLRCRHAKACASGECSRTSLGTTGARASIDS